MRGSATRDLLHVYSPEGRAEQLYLCLPRTRRRRGTRHGRRPRGHRIPLERGIACRPADVATQESFGHWEGDLLVFAKSAGNARVTTLVERRSRFLVLLPNPDRRPAGVAERIQTALGGLAQDLRQTVTFDRGFEFMGYPALDRGLAVTSYFCDPRSPWQKGAVENTNGRLRRYLPSDVPAERLTAESLEALANRFNATPRCCLGYRTPAEVFEGRLDPNPAKCDTAAAVSHLA
ncbi:MAG TPA: IS30 family transposase [Acetobacteraceae bacterium]